MTNALIFIIVLTIVGATLYRLERNRPERLSAGSLHGSTAAAEDRDLSRLHTELRAIADHQKSWLARWSMPARRVSPLWQPWHLA